MTAIYLLLLIAFLVLAVPVGFGIGGTSIVLSLIERGSDFSATFLVQRLSAGLDNFLLLSVPLFLYVGKVMNVGSISNRIFSFASALVGGFRGGLGHVNVVSSAIFAGMSGTAASDAAGLGAIELAAMKEGGYPDDFSIGITAASSTLGPIIPPSLPLVLYGMITGASIGGLLIGGIIPGVLMVLAMMLYVEIYARRHGMQKTGRFSIRRAWKELRRSFFSLLTPVIILGGIMSGFFTPTEAAAAAAVYSTILTLCMGELTWDSFKGIVKETVEDSGAILLVAGMATVYGYLITRANIATNVAAMIGTISRNPVIVGLILIVFLLIVGCFMDCNAAIMVLGSTLLPILEQSSIDPLHFGIIMVLTLMVGVMTPPFGMVLFIMQRHIKRPMSYIIKSCLPFILPLLIIDIIILAFPPLVTWLPSVMGLLS